MNFAGPCRDCRDRSNTAASSSGGLWSSPWTRLTVQWLISILVAGKWVTTTFALAWNQDPYTHILLILPVSWTMLFVGLRTLKYLPQPRSWVAGCLLGAALLGTAVGICAFLKLNASAQLCVVMVALVIWWIGSFVLCFGTQISRSLVFPLFLLFWVVPFPPVLVDKITVVLQRASAFAASGFFLIAGIPAIRKGITISIPGLTIEVASECSSVRSSLILVVTTMILAQLFLRSPWRKGLVFLAAVPLAILKNGFRIFTIAILATRVDPEYLTGRLHHDGGILFLALSLVTVLLVLCMLRHGDHAASRHPVT